MEIILARHGRTNENKNKNLSGNSDKAQLIEEGKEHASTLVTLFLGDGIERILASPLDRAMDTAKPIAKALKLKIEKEDLLREFDFGDLDGLPEEGKATEGLKRRRKELHFRFPNGESYGDVIVRAKKLLDSISRAKEKRILLVAHAGINRAIISLLLDNGFSKSAHKLDTIDCHNSLVYIFDTKTKKIRWIDTRDNKKGDGLIKRKAF